MSAPGRLSSALLRALRAAVTEPSPGNSHSRDILSLLAIPDAPPAVFRHWRQHAPVPSTMLHISRNDPGAALYRLDKKKTQHMLSFKDALQ